MSRFYGNLKGSRGEATRQGTAKSDMRGHIRGWHIGARITVYADEKDNDTVSIILTGGSSNPSGQLSLGVWQLGEDGLPKKVRD